MNLSLLRKDLSGRRPTLPLMGEEALALARVHEFCGPARVFLALAVAARAEGPVLWLRLCWQEGRLHPPGVARLIDPARLIVAEAEKPEDLLWSMEAALRSGAAPMVVAEMPEPPPLTPVRRLHLAAEDAPKGSPPPLALILTPGMGGAQGVESRWHIRPLPDGGWHLRRLRARMAAEAEWPVIWRGGQLQNRPPAFENRKETVSVTA